MRRSGQVTGPAGGQACLALDLPGHGNSHKAEDPKDYSLPGYAKTLKAFAQATSAEDAVIVSWSLGGHIALEAAPLRSPPPRSSLDLDEIVADVLRTDGAARAGLGASLAEGRYADEVAITSELRKPLAILHGEGEQLISLDYLRTLRIPALWRKEIQLIPGAGHAPHLEAPEAFTALLQAFLADLG